MTSRSQLFREAQEMEQRLLRLYYETNETLKPTRYHPSTVADAVHRAFKRTARRRDKMLNSWDKESEATDVK